MMKTQINDSLKSSNFFLTVGELYPHPLLERIGVLPDMIERETRKSRQSGSNREDHKTRAANLSLEFSALVESIIENGITDALKVSKGLASWLIADGRNRWLAAQEILEADPLDECWLGRKDKLEARQAELEKGIPCVEIDDATAPAVILAAMTRRNMSKQAQALMAVRIYPEVAEASAGRPKKLGNDYPIITQEALAARVGVSAETMKDACLFWRKLNLLAKPEMREEAQNQVFAGISFENVALGWPSAIKKGQAKQIEKPALLMLRNANSMLQQWVNWEQFTDDARVNVTEKLVEAISAAPEDVKNALKAALEGVEA